VFNVPVTADVVNPPKYEYTVTTTMPVMTMLIGVSPKILFITSTNPARLIMMTPSSAPIRKTRVATLLMEFWNRARMNSASVYPDGIFWRSFKAKGTMMITASPLGTMNQTRPEVPQV
jgi:hypothetical protein